MLNNVTVREIVNEGIGTTWVVRFITDRRQYVLTLSSDMRLVEMVETMTMLLGSLLHFVKTEEVFQNG